MEQNKPLLSVIMPTKGRGPQALLCIERMFETAPGFDIECVVVAYPDDSNKAVFSQSRHNIQVIWESCGPVEAWNKGASIARGNFLKVGEDDLWYEPHWLSYTMDVIDNLPNQYGYVKIRSDASTYWAERAIASRQFLIDIFGGVLNIPHYISQYDDRERTDRAIAAGLFFHSPKAYIEHRHWKYGKGKDDETYDRGGLYHYKQDEITYKTRKAAGFPTDYKAVIK